MYSAIILSHLCLVTVVYCKCSLILSTNAIIMLFLMLVTENSCIWRHLFFKHCRICIHLKKSVHYISFQLHRVMKKLFMYSQFSLFRSLRIYYTLNTPEQGWLMNRTKTWKSDNKSCYSNL